MSIYHFKVDFLSTVHTVNIAIAHLPTPTPPQGKTAVHIAAQRGCLLCLETLLALDGASPNCIADWGWSPLLLACDGAHQPCIKLLLEKNADLAQKRSSDGAHCGLVLGTTNQIGSGGKLVELGELLLAENATRRGTSDGPAGRREPVVSDGSAATADENSSSVATAPPAPPTGTINARPPNPNSALTFTDQPLPDESPPDSPRWLTRATETAGRRTLLHLVTASGTLGLSNAVAVAWLLQRAV